MGRMTLRVRIGIVVALTVPLALVLARVSAAPEKTPAAVALEKEPGLREKLAAAETFKKLKDKAKQAKIDDKTYYFVEGDLRLDEDQLLFYARELDAQHAKFEAAKLGVGTPAAPVGSTLMVHVKNGKLMRWQPGATLTYCVQQKTFGGDYDMVVANMAKATKDWEKTCNIKFKHVKDKDTTTPAATPPAGVTFTVRKVNDNNGPIASAFFPGDPAGDRHLLLFPSYLTTSFDKVGVLRHELGHVLGFRHEHIRSQAPAVCQGEGIFGAIPATAYDPQSVMHYFCGGAGSLPLAISVLDREGARLIYGPPTGVGGGLEDPLKRPIDTQSDELKKGFTDIEP